MTFPSFKFHLSSNKNYIKRRFFMEMTLSENTLILAMLLKNSLQQMHLASSITFVKPSAAVT